MAGLALRNVHKSFIEMRIFDGVSLDIGTKKFIAGAANSVFLEANAGWIAPGHKAVASDARRDGWIVYHAVDARRTRNKDSEGVNSRQIMLVDWILWVDGWPRVAGNSLSSGPRPAPRMKR